MHNYYFTKHVMYCFEDFYLKVNDYISKSIDNNTGTKWKLHRNLPKLKPVGCCIYSSWYNQLAKILYLLYNNTNYKSSQLKITKM